MVHKNRRKIERLSPITKVHVTIMAGGDLLAARVSNISSSGVAVIYENSQIPCCEIKVRVDLLANGSTNLMVTGLQCRTVYDRLTLAEGSSYTGMFTRLCGLKFIAPSDHQNELLDRLITGVR